ncbi:MAG: hypothetical protein ABIB47_03220 [Candidatus Woesearchaeota archaeon]
MAKLGVFYTIGFFIVILVFFSFVVIINRNFISTSERLEEDLGYEQIRNLDLSIQKGFKDIFTMLSGISVSKGTNSVTFTEILPNPSDSNFKSNISQYKTFLESNYPVIFEVEEINGNLPLIIQPYGIELGHLSYGGAEMNLTWKQVNFDGFVVTIQADVVLNSGSCDTSGSSSSPYLNLNAYGSSGSCTVTDNSHVEIFDTQLPPNLQVTLDLDEASQVLTVVASETVTAAVSVEGLTDMADDTIVTLPEEVLSYNFGDLNFIKNGTIRLL